MTNRTYLFIFFFLATFFAATKSGAQVPPILWQKTIGGSGDDILSGVDALSEGIMLSGYSNSGTSGDKKDTSRGGYDFWLVKLSAGNTPKIMWEKSYGGNFDDTAVKVLKTTDGGYLLSGTTLSTRSGDKIQTTWGFSPDYWVLKLDKNGQIIWQRNLGGTFTEKATGLSETSYGYAVMGHSYSDVSGDKTSDNTGFENRADLWLVFLETTGHTKKTYTYGTIGQDLSCCLVSSDNGNVIGSTTYSRATLGQKTRDPYGNCDYWVVRTDLSGARVYDSTFGGVLSDNMTCMTATHNGRIILGGYSNSPISGMKTDSCRGATDFWIISMDQNGNVIWQKTIGGSGADYMTCIKETRDGGFIAGGYSSSNKSNEKSEDSKGGNDYWIVKLDSSGNKQWDKTFGGSGDDKLVSVDELSLNEYVLSGTSNSPVSGDKDTTTIGGTGKSDFWIIRLGKGVVDSGGVTPPPADSSKVGKYVLDVRPNPTHNTLYFRFSSTDDEMTPFTLHSYDGKKVMSFSYMATKDLQDKQVSVVGLQSGVYYLTMYTKQKKITKMVLVQ